MKKKYRPIYITLILIAIAGVIFLPKLLSYFGSSNEDKGALPASGPRALHVDALVIKTQRLVEVINSSGTIMPDEQVDLSFETSGKIVELKFDEGSKVSKGQLLAKINDAHLQAQLQKLKAQKKLTEEREFRQRTLLSRDAISQESYDQVVTELQTIGADIMLVEARIAETELRGPFDGIIGLRHVSEGAFVNMNTQIAQLIKNNPLKIEFAIPERYSGEIQPGFPIKFTLDGIQDSLFAKVYAVEPKVDIRTRNVVVRARYFDPNERIKPGRFVSIQLELSSVNNAIAIPTESLIPEMEGDRVFVYRSGKAESVLVKTGLRTEDMIQITNGLEPGDTLITTGILQLRRGISVNIDNIK
ncbi:MAG: efflux RND transporter periplasmic adaptor subunit [Bacteroidetes bacterium]|nr:efflux RND transporter periplasmic adaptor subunit [Bacteroidota bacterium]